jgi:gamma-glutamylcyclotransferase (GGCT)/AIG2-like uncharacterized protein YtfP
MEFFTYGTLRPGGDLYGQIEAVVVDDYEASLEGRLFVLPSGYPILVEAEPGYPIMGRILTLPDSPVTLQRLDRIEGSGRPDSLYLRVTRRVITARGDTMAWVYVCKSEHATGVLSSSQELIDGDWFGYRS